MLCHPRTLLRIRAVAADWMGLPEEEAVQAIYRNRKGVNPADPDMKRLSVPRATPPSLAQVGASSPGRVPHCAVRWVQVPADG